MVSLRTWFVLIETLWNVNSAFAVVILSSSSVLIETLWNVNEVESGD